MQIDFNIENQRLNKLNESFIVENSQNYLECSFIFSDDWQSFKKLAYFQSTLDSVPKIVEIVDDKCIVPHESIKAPFLKVWVIGYKDEVKITTNFETLSIIRSGVDVGDEIIEKPSKELWETLFNDFEFTYDKKEGNLKIAMIDVTGTRKEKNVIIFSDTDKYIVSVVYEETNKQFKFTFNDGDSITCPFKVDLGNYYTKTETNTLLDNYYTKTETDLKFLSKEQAQNTYATISSVDELSSIINSNRGIIDSIQSEINVMKGNLDNVKSSVEEAQNKAQEAYDLALEIDGSPKGVYANLSALQTAFPSGAQGVYVTTDNGHWYYWNGTAWTDGGVYQTDLSYDEVKKNLNNIRLENKLENPKSYTALHGTTTLINGVYTLTSNNDGGTPRSMLVLKEKLVSGHEYYFSISITPKVGTPNRLTVQTMYKYSNMGIVTTGIELNKEIIISGKYTSNNTDDVIAVVAEYSNSTDASLNFTNVYLVDLTETNLTEEYVKKMIDMGGVFYLKDVPDKIEEVYNYVDVTYSKWKMFSFISANRRLITLCSKDGVNWKMGKTNNHTPVTDTCLRDPSILYKDGMYYMIYSRILNDIPFSQDYSTGQYIGFAKSKDLITWEEQEPISCPGYSDIWAPEWFKKSDGSYGIVLSCKNDSTNVVSAYYLDVIDFDNFSYGTLQPLPLVGTPTYMIDLDIKSFKGVNYLCYTAGNKIRFAKEINGTYTSYTANAEWYDYSMEGGFMVEMNGFVRLYTAYHQDANNIYYADSYDMVNWGEMKPCNLPLEALQHCSIIYEDEWICKKFNMIE